MSDITVVVGYIIIIFIMCKAWNWHVMKRYAKQKEKKLNFTKIFCEKYLEKIFFRFLTGKVDPYMHSHFLILICECFDVLKNPEYWKAVGYTLCKDIKDEIEINGIKGKLGIWSGVGIKAFAINEYCNRFCLLFSCNDAVLHLLMSELESLCKSYLFNQDSITIRQYDVCFGVCGCKKLETLFGDCWF